jgi:hypothetical protein
MSIRRASTTRSIARAAVVAGVLAVTTAGGTAGAFAASHGPDRTGGYAPTEECLNWSGNLKAFPALGTTSKSVTEVVQATLSNCNFDGTGQTYSGSVFGVLSGKATKNKGTLSGNLAITWPADANLNPTIVPVTVSGSAAQFSLYGTISAGAGTGNQLEGNYDVISTSAITGGSSQNILGSQPFGIFVNEG